MILFDASNVLSFTGSAADFVTQLLLQMAPVVGLPLIAWLGKRAASWIGAHTKNQQMAGVWSRLEATAEAVVRSKFNEVVDDLKADAADGKISPDELKAELAKQKAEAVATFKKLMTAEGLLHVSDVLGLGSGDVETLLSTVLESVLHKVKLQVDASAPAAQADPKAVGPLP